MIRSLVNHITFAIRRTFRPSLVTVALAATASVIGGIAWGFDCYTINGNTCQNLVGGNCFASGGMNPCYNSTGTCTYMGVTSDHLSFRWEGRPHWQCSTNGAGSASTCISVPGANSPINACYVMTWWNMPNCMGAAVCATLGTAGSCTTNPGTDCTRLDPP